MMPFPPLLYGLLLALGWCCALLLLFTRWTAFCRVHRLLLEQTTQFLPPRSAPIAPPSYQVEAPLLTVVLPCVDEVAQLQRHLVSWLKQEMERFEIVVADASDDDGATRQLVTQWQQSFPHLRYTRLPSTHRNLDRRLAALALGMRAARAPWVLLSRPDCWPSDPRTLEAFMLHCTKERDVVIGRIDFEDLGSECLRTSYEHYRRLALNVSSTLKGRPCGGDSRCILLRQEWWRACGGFADGLDLGYGECAFLVDRYAQPDRIAMALTATTAVKQDIPEGEDLTILRRESREIRKRLQAHRGSTFVGETLAMWAWVFLGMLLLTFVLLRLLHFFGAALWPMMFSEVPSYFLTDLLYDLPALLLLLFALCAPVAAVRPTLQTFMPDYRGATTLYPLLFDTLLPLRRKL